MRCARRNPSDLIISKRCRTLFTYMCCRFSRSFAHWGSQSKQSSRCMILRDIRLPSPFSLDTLILRLLDQRADEAQKLLLFGTLAATREESPDFDISYMASRRKIGFVSNQHSTGFGITNEIPPVAVGTGVKFSCLN